MRKNVKNDKVLKAITIGLAAMIATTSVPVTVLADESDNSDSPASNESIPESTEETTEASSEEVSVSDASNECNEIIEQTAPDTVDAIGDAAEAVSGIETADPAVVDEIKAVKADLAAGAGYVEDAAGDLGTAVERFNEVLAGEVKIEDAVSSGNDEVNNANANIAAVNAAVDTADKAADNTLDNVDTANTSASRTEAYAAKDSAEEALSVAEAGLEAAQEAYALADEAAAKAQADLDKALDEQEEAQKNLDKAKEALDNADDNAIAANERLKAAQDKMDAINAKVEKLAENKEQLEAIQHQYYAMMVKFFQVSGISIVYEVENNNDNKNAHKERTVDIKKTIENLKNDPSRIDNAAKSGDRVYLGLGRYLTKLLVEQMILSDENVNPETADIMFGTEGDSMDGLAGAVFTNWSYAAQVTYSGDNDMYDFWHQKDLKEEDKIEVGDAVKMQWKYTNQNDDGRTNYVTVTYTDKNGEVQTKHYNYIRKYSKYGDELDIENGMFYLAEVEKDEAGNYVVTRIVDNEYNFDDYSKLMDAFKTLTDIEEYNAAKAAVDEAQSKVQALQKQIERLKNVTLDSRALDNLRDSLETAQAELAAAGEAKDALEEKVAEARAAVESIDLSRFNVSPAGTSEDEDAADEDTTATEAAAPTAAVTPASVTVTVPGLGIDPIVLPAAGAAGASGTGEAASPARGVAGVRVPAGSGNGAADEAADIEDGSGIEEVPVQGSMVIYDLEEIDNSENGRKLVRIEDNAVPLAAAPEEAQHISWWWLIIIALLGATGKKMYDEHQKKAEAAEAQK